LLEQEINKRIQFLRYIHPPKKRYPLVI
jgi:hypothetical protein